MLVASGAAVALASATVVALRRSSHDPVRPGSTFTALGEPIRSELAYKVDTLPNGLRYYVSAHRSASKRTELRLIVDAGSVQEEEDERGLAHAVEHMVFRGTRSFPNEAIERYFDRIGMRRGDDVNATTSFDDTQFRMSVPSARAGAVDTALAMLASMARDASFDSADASREAGVLFEEWRGSLDADSRLTDARRPLLYAGTPYAARPVIGDTAVLRRFDRRAMRHFYDAWYRPELMAVIVVGAFKPTEVEAMIRRHFAGIRGVGPRRARPARPKIVATAAPRALVVPDAEIGNSSVSIWLPTVRQQYATRGDYRASMIASLWRDALQARLTDAEFDAHSPLADIDVDRRSLARDISADVVSVTAMQGQTLRALDAAAAEMKALGNEGPGAAELEERIRAIQREARVDAEGGDDNADIANELVDLFLTGNAVFTSNTAYELARDVLPTITADDVRAFAKSRTALGGAVVVVATAAEDSAALVPADSIVTRVRMARARPPRARHASGDVRDLLASDPTPGRIVSERPIPAIGAYQWTLSNGMRVLVKPTAFTFDNIELRAIAPGGASLASDEEYPSAWLADAIIGETGVGSIPAPRLKRWLGSTSISLAPTVTDDGITLDGHTAHADLDAFFELLHLYLTSPRRDTVAFRRYRARSESFVRDRARDPAMIFRDSVVAALGGGDPRAMRFGAQFHRRAQLDAALDFWSDRTKNGANFIVAIAGDFTLARIRPLVERYLASLPRGTTEHPRDRGFVNVRGARHDLTVRGVERARTAIGFVAPLEETSANVTALQLVRDLIERTLNERLREQMGGTYDVDVTLAIDVVPPSKYAITIEFESAPGRANSLAKAVLEGLRDLHRSGPDSVVFRAAREARVRDFDDRAENNEYWVSELTSHARFGWSLPDIATHAEAAGAVSLADARRACARFVSAGDYVRVTMRPREAAPNAREGLLPRRPLPRGSDGSSR